MQSPQMIQAMQILQTPLLELKDQIEQELQENVFLELKEDPQESAHEPEQKPALEDKLQREFSEQLDQLEQRMGPGTRGLSHGSGGGAGDDEDKKQAALNNTPVHGISLPEHLMSQARMLDLDPELLHVVEHVIYSLDSDAKLADTAEHIAQQLLVPIPLAEEAIEVVRDMEPCGMAARDLRDRLLMQLDCFLMQQEPSITLFQGSVVAI
jgi:RNA polymerase sigma-54 factor